MGTIDIVILIVIFIGLGRGFTTGGIRQVFSLVGLVVALVLAARMMEGVSGGIGDRVGVPPSMKPLLSFVAVFLGVQGAVYLLGRLFESVLQALSLGILNRLLGGAIGAFKAALLLSVLFFVGGYLGLPAQQSQEQSMFYRPIYDVLPSTWRMVSGRLPNIAPFNRSNNPLPGGPSQDEFNSL